MTKVKEIEKQYWRKKFTEVVSKHHHKRNIAIIVEKLLDRSQNTKNSMVSRSNKKNVLCTITVENIRQSIYDKYGTPCKYDRTRILDYKNMAFDHTIPISKGGESTKENIQLISRFSNNIKGSLTEKQFFLLLKWLDILGDELKKYVKMRLAGKRHYA